MEDKRDVPGLWSEISTGVTYPRGRQFDGPANLGAPPSVTTTLRWYRELKCSAARPVRARP
jgi:hypothetical protein